MWEVLELACSNSTAIAADKGLLHWTLAPIESPPNLNELVFEVGCADSPDVNVDTSDGGQSAPPMVISMTPVASLSYPGMATPAVFQTLPTDALATNNASGSLLWDGNSFNTSIHSYDLQTGALGDMENSSWWDFGNL
jgi:hypothetical protein